ncbi:hypothetical protein J1605_007544 [Eschrichtius robustus]|uniref:Uncharacterized protein n=1 Tax=Eschrichtius robustus TaxID=9764 RepID=A0AB34GZU6_ESCRO|nr:hypothetical protein J1605_007544 [Eschrichtius robustus]
MSRSGLIMVPCAWAPVSSEASLLPELDFALDSRTIVGCPSSPFPHCWRLWLEQKNPKVGSGMMTLRRERCCREFGWVAFAFGVEASRTLNKAANRRAEVSEAFRAPVETCFSPALGSLHSWTSQGPEEKEESQPVLGAAWVKRESRPFADPVDCRVEAAEAQVPTRVLAVGVTRKERRSGFSLSLDPFQPAALLLLPSGWSHFLSSSLSSPASPVPGLMSGMPSFPVPHLSSSPWPSPNSASTALTVSLSTRKQSNLFALESCKGEDEVSFVYRSYDNKS